MAVDLVGEVAGDLVEAAFGAIGDIAEQHAVDRQLVDVASVPEVAVERDGVLLLRRRIGVGAVKACSIVELISSTLLSTRS